MASSVCKYHLPPSQIYLSTAMGSHACPQEFCHSKREACTKAMSQQHSPMCWWRRFAAMVAQNWCVDIIQDFTIKDFFYNIPFLFTYMSSKTFHNGFSGNSSCKHKMRAGLTDAYREHANQNEGMENDSPNCLTNPVKNEPFPTKYVMRNVLKTMWRPPSLLPPRQLLVPHQYEWTSCGEQCSGHWHIYISVKSSKAFSLLTVIVLVVVRWSFIFSALSFRSLKPAKKINAIQ